MTYQEFWNTAWDVRKAILATVENHWKYHQHNWETNEDERLYRCNKMFTALGRPDIYEEIFLEVNRIFEKHNKTTSGNAD